MFKDFMDNLGFQIAFSDLDDIVAGIESHQNDWDDYYKQKRLIQIYLECIAEKCERLEWRWLFDEGHLCEKDFEWFAEPLAKHELTLEKYREKLK